MSEPPVILVHGLGGSTRRTWAETGLLDLLADIGRTPIGLDLLGHGTQDKPHDPAAYAALEDHVLARLPDGTVDAVGFSLGARVLLQLASRHPERFGRLVVAGAGANLFGPEGSTALATVLEGGDAPDAPPMARYFVQQAAEDDGDPRAVAALLRRDGPPPLDEATLARVRADVLVVLGDADFVGPADRLLAALPHARLVTLRGVDHFATPKDFGFIDAVLDFLAPGPA